MSAELENEQEDAAPPSTKEEQKPEDDGVLRFDLDFETKEVQLRDPKTGKVELYTLHERDGVMRDKWMQNIGERLKYNPKTGKSQGLGNYKGMQSFLVSLCMEDSKGKAVEEKWVQGLPAKIQSKLFDTCKTMNGLDDEEDDDGNSPAEEKAKND